nr:unnamed protein product [Callosobruchus chinensis]
MYHNIQFDIVSIQTRAPLPHGSTSHLPVSYALSKILEKVVYLQLAKYFEDNNMFPAYQSGFRAGYSTMQCLANLLLSILESNEIL